MHHERYPDRSDRAQPPASAGPDTAALRLPPAVSRLPRDWQILSDLAFSDLVLWLPSINTRDATGKPDQADFVAAAQARPFTAQTTLIRDLIGSAPRTGLQPLLMQVLRTGIPVNGSEQLQGSAALGVTVWPVVDGDEVLAVLSVHKNLARQRHSSRLEQAYHRSAQDLLMMISRGLWPEPDQRHGPSLSDLRVGDGMIRLDAQGLVNFISPNAVSGLRKLGIRQPLEGRQLSRVVTDYLPPRGHTDHLLPSVLYGVSTETTEIETRKVSLSIRSIPLRDRHRERYAAVLLIRDVTELRHRDRQLIGKDATIKEIHHRVKNNLQTVGSLLRMQSRRMTSPEAKHELLLAMGRVDTIARVHETLSQSVDRRIDMDELLSQQFTMAVDIANTGRDIHTEISTAFGQLSSELATPLALIVNELATNAVEHGLDSELGGTVWFRAYYSTQIPENLPGTELTSRPVEHLIVEIEDSGRPGRPGYQGTRGPDRPEHTSATSAGGLGTQIIRTLVASDLHGTISWQLATPGGRGTLARVSIPVE
ncbi:MULTISPECIES: sensor histidine kinase [Auritidibacter]|uniref:sensor histidine kinase n=1 Tax=Auritidibacter TaxID=1160973 RepID=UPI000D73CEDA|nr:MULTISPECIES: sensor histidine kinase [Auritidibacter]NIH71636.1 two-component sensor histidine kinase [Auritidibacter ignavus]PXA81935.1 ATPase [Auritidibacter sp. NML120636]RMX24218.1 ATPase [Auritidibacter ignavus]WGH81729.1 sensor histidine kinase [Auritidibacter ignavus]WGH86342.1 sensor histidine kinase [Auritidibacter ignavus]